jgi:hypothetical protein
MRITKLLLICICCVLVAPALWGQNANSQAAKPGILGYLDPKTGAFRPVPMATDEELDPTTFTTFTGTITTTITITVKSTGLTTIGCSLEADVEDNITTAFRSYDESVSAVATGSGSTRTCKLTIPYSWSLATQPSDNINVSYLVFGGTATNVTARTTALSPLATKKVPSSGTTTTLTAAVTL